MSRAGPTYIQRRSGIYHLRVRVPDDLRARVGLLEVRRSLGVYNLPKARKLALTYSARVLEVFEMVRSMPIPKDAIRSLIQDRFVDLVPVWDQGYLPETALPQFEVAEQRGCAEDRIADLLGQLECGAFEPAVIRSADRILASRGIAPSDAADATRVDAMSGVARALIEQQRLFIFRLSERLLPYEPVDPLFSGLTVGRSSMPVGAIGAVRRETLSQVQAIGPTLSELRDKYLSAKKATGRWTDKTYRARTQQTLFMLEHFGSDVRAASITATQVKEYRDALCRLRSKHHVGPGKSFLSRQTDDASKRVDGRTADNLFEVCKALFKWAKSETYLDVNVAADVMNAEHPKTKAKDGAKKRRPFDAEELKTIFAAPLYTGCKTVSHRFEDGPNIYSDGRYWIPIIGHSMGMRLGEIVQLQITDIVLDAAIPYLRITEERGGKAGSGTEKFVKSDAGVRDVPLHPMLLELGFDMFVRRVEKSRKRQGRLFYEIDYGRDGMPSTRFSKWFARLLDTVGLTDPALVFHSFRHAAEDAFRNASLPEYVIDQIIGHADGKTSSGYGEGVGLSVKLEAMKAMKFKVDVVALLADHRPSSF